MPGWLTGTFGVVTSRSVKKEGKKNCLLEFHFLFLFLKVVVLLLIYLILGIMSDNPLINFITQSSDNWTFTVYILTRLEISEPLQCTYLHTPIYMCMYISRCRIFLYPCESIRNFYYKDVCISLTPFYVRRATKLL